MDRCVDGLFGRDVWMYVRMVGNGRVVWCLSVDTHSVSTRILSLGFHCLVDG